MQKRRDPAQEEKKDSSESTKTKKDTKVGKRSKVMNGKQTRDARIHILAICSNFGS